MEKIRTQGMGIRISILERVMKIYFNRGLEDMEIGWGQQYALECIAGYPGITALELAKDIRVDKATVTKLMKKLLKLNYIVVEPDEKDRRIRHLYLTKHAEEALERIRIIQKEFEEDLMAGFSQEEKTQMEQGMEQMIANLTVKSREKLEKPYLERENER